MSIFMLEQRGIAKTGFEAGDRTINNMTNTAVSTHYKLDTDTSIAEKQ